MCPPWQWNVSHTHADVAALDIQHNRLAAAGLTGSRRKWRRQRHPAGWSSPVRVTRGTAANGAICVGAPAGRGGRGGEGTALAPLAADKKKQTTKKTNSQATRRSPKPHGPAGPQHGGPLNMTFSWWCFCNAQLEKQIITRVLFCTATWKSVSVGTITSQMATFDQYWYY